MQLENEYGFIGDAHDKHYMRHLVRLARKALGDDIVLFTTDPPPNVEKGSLPDDEIFRLTRPHAENCLGVLPFYPEILSCSFGSLYTTHYQFSS